MKIIENLQAVVKEYDLAAPFFQWLSSYSNSAYEMSVETVEREFSKWLRENDRALSPVLRKDIIKLMKALEEAQVGQFWTGRRGKKSRFEFWAHRGHIAEAAIGKRTEIEIWDEQSEQLENYELIELHKRLLANALHVPVGAVTISVQE